MTLLELVNAFRQEIVASGNVLTTVEGTLPRDVKRQTAWIVRAWERIQAIHSDWQFMRLSSTHTIPQYGSVLSPTEYTAGEVSRWIEDSFRLAESGEGRHLSKPLDYHDYEGWVNGVGLNLTTYAKPSSYTIRPHDNALMVAPAADAAYELYYDYVRTPQTLSADDDVPICPPRYHMIIVHRAMMYYGRSVNAPEMYSDGQAEFNNLLALMENTQLPQLTLGCFVE